MTTSTYDLTNQKSNSKPQGLLLAASLTFVIVGLFAPLIAVVALPVLIVLAAHHSIAMAQTAGSPIPFAALLGLDILMICVVAGSLIRAV